jgi:hypothetical protein
VTLSPAAHRGLEARRILLQVAHHIRTGHEPVRIAPLIREDRQPDRPIGGHEREGVPPPVPPGRCDLWGLFQHHVRTGLLGQIVADGQPGLSAANDHSLDLLRHVCVLLWQILCMLPYGRPLSRMSSSVSLWPVLTSGLTSGRTPGFSRAWKRERSGRWKASAAHPL